MADIFFCESSDFLLTDAATDQPDDLLQTGSPPKTEFQSLRSRPNEWERLKNKN